MVAAAQIQIYDDVRVLRRVVTALVHDLEAQLVKGTVRKFHTGVHGAVSAHGHNLL